MSFLFVHLLNILLENKKCTLAKQKSSEFQERCVCKEEAELSIKENGLVSKFAPHQDNPKWIAIKGTRPNCAILGKRKNYSHKLIFEVEQGTIEWLEAFETKPENEPNSFELPRAELLNFNLRVLKITVEDNLKIVQRRKNK